MACGNNNVSRGYLSAQPTPPQPPRGAAPRDLGRQKALPSQIYPKAKGKKEWYSSYNGKGEIQVMLDERGRPTKEYPHVHVIHDPNKNEIRLHNTLRKGVHVEKSKLPGGASGNQVNAAVADLLDGLPRWFQ